MNLLTDIQFKALCELLVVSDLYISLPFIPEYMDLEHFKQYAVHRQVKHYKLEISNDTNLESFDDECIQVLSHLIRNKLTLFHKIANHQMIRKIHSSL